MCKVNFSSLCVLICFCIFVTAFPYNICAVIYALLIFICSLVLRALKFSCLYLLLQFCASLVFAFANSKFYFTKRDDVNKSIRFSQTEFSKFCSMAITTGIGFIMLNNSMLNFIIIISTSLSLVLSAKKKSKGKGNNNSFTITHTQTC